MATKELVIMRACRRCLRQLPVKHMRLVGSLYHRSWGWLCLTCHAKRRTEHLSWKVKHNEMTVETAVQLMGRAYRGRTRIA